MREPQLAAALAQLLCCFPAGEQNVDILVLLQQESWSGNREGFGAVALVAGL